MEISNKVRHKSDLNASQKIYNAPKTYKIQLYINMECCSAKNA